MNDSRPDLSCPNGYDPDLPEALGRLQRQFAGYIRDPQGRVAPTAIEDRRMAIYRQLFFNNIENFISGSFPVSRKLFTDAQWQRLVRGFYRDYRCHSPLFPEIPREFLRYLESIPLPEDKPFLLELCHYEWIETALELDDHTLDTTDIDPEGDLIETLPVLSPQARVLCYRWPVEKIRPDYQPVKCPREATFLLVHRDNDDEVRFTRLNQVSARLLELITSMDYPNGKSCIDQINHELGRKNDHRILDFARQLLEDFRSQGIIVGSRRSEEVPA